MEEASELCQASNKADVAAEAADLFYFALVKCLAAEVTLEDVGRNLDYKSLKTIRRKGDAKKQWMENGGLKGLTSEPSKSLNEVTKQGPANNEASRSNPPQQPAGVICG